MNPRRLLVALVLLVGAGCASPAKITNFEECAAAGNPVMESYPRQCRADGQTFVEEVSAPTEPTPDAPGDLVLTPAAEYGKPVTIEDGGSAVFADGLQVTVLGIDDSRCPADVQCVWAGELAPKLSVMLLDSADAPVEVALGTLTRKEAQALGRAFTLADATEESVTIVVAR